MPNVSDLIFAANSGRFEMVQELIAIFGVDATENDNRHFARQTTALMAAAEDANSKIILWLLDQGANASLKNEFGRNALFILLKSRRAKFNDDLDALASAIAQKIVTNHEDSHIALYLAAELGLPKTVATLIAQHADLNKNFKITNSSNKLEETSPFKGALLGGNSEVIRAFFETGDVNPNQIINGTKLSALLFAAQFCTAETLNLMLGPFIKQPEADFKELIKAFKLITARTDFRKSFHQQYSNLILTIIQQSDIISDGYFLDDVTPPIFDAITAPDSVNVISWMVDAGFDPQLCNDLGENGIAWALRIKNEDLCLNALATLVFLNVPVDIAYAYPNAPNDKKFFAILTAVISSSARVVSLLASETSKINDIFLSNDEPTTLLIEACKTIYKESAAKAETLIKHGADLFQQVEYLVRTNNDGSQIKIQLNAFRAAALFNNPWVLLKLLETAKTKLEQQETLNQYLDETFMDYDGKPSNICSLVLTENTSYPPQLINNIIQTLINLGCTSYTAIIDGMPMIARAVITNPDINLTPFIADLDITFPYTHQSGKTLQQLNLNVIGLLILKDYNIVRLTRLLDQESLSPEQKTTLINSRINENNRTALMILMSMQCFPTSSLIAKLNTLVINGADLSARDTNGMTALDHFQASTNLRYIDKKGRKQISNLLTPPKSGLYFGCMPRLAPLPKPKIEEQTQQQRTTLSL